MSFPSDERAMYFSVALIVITTQPLPRQVMPALFAVTVGVPVVSVTRTVTSVPSQTGIRCAVAPSEPGSMTLAVMKFTTLGLLLGL